MEHAKKFALIPEHLMSKHTVSDKQLNDLDKCMLNILNSSLEEHEKVKQYYALLQKKMNIEEYNLPWKPPEETAPLNNIEVEPMLPRKEDPYDRVVLNSVPQGMKNEASKALDYIKEHSNILKWNDKGEILIGNELISKTNIADLFNIIFTHNKKKINVAGIQEFLAALNLMNMPKQYVKNNYLTAKNVKSKAQWMKY
ncbi:hypothetical protein AVEN_158491-1 [Araneus ventricosus]|uniref:Uncharacterized protein n=1 Tax=Araneus ventricosus TaxID=182803 RepID=A0A4Y2DMK1_ARAVE|nr:hypothetical protein AVEN_13419-1 [Araneus ventricosus]GBN74998.1 hypothetical protein AVEN_158491-1 [Araneus ventricosus]